MGPRYFTECISPKVAKLHVGSNHRKPVVDSPNSWSGSGGNWPWNNLRQAEFIFLQLCMLQCMSQTNGQSLLHGESVKMAKNKMTAEMYENRPKLRYAIVRQRDITVLNCAIYTCHWNILKILWKTFPNMQTKRKSVQKWRTHWGLKSCFSTNVATFRTFFNTISQIPQPNIAIPTYHWYALKVL